MGCHRSGASVAMGLCSEDLDSGNLEHLLLTPSVNVSNGTKVSVYTTSNNNSVEAVGVSTNAANSGLVCKVTIPAKNTPSSSLSTQKLGKWAIKYM